MATLLQVVQRHCRRQGLSYPSAVISSSDDTLMRIVGLLSEECEWLAERYCWEELVNTASWTTTATEDQGALTTLASNGFFAIREGTFWDRTAGTPVRGPISKEDWAYYKAIGILGTVYQWRISGGSMLIAPTPTAGLTFAFEYWSNNWCLAADGVTYQQDFTGDEDTLLVPSTIAQKGLRWRWKKDLGLEYAEDFREYEVQVNNLMGKDGGKKVIDATGYSEGIQPGVALPPGWVVR